MSERRASSNTNRQCARFGCSASAVATFTFDAEARTVWLDTPLDGNARAGELCIRHAAALTPPRGWLLEDRRPGRSEPINASVTSSSSATSSPATSTSTVATSTTASTATPSPATPSPAPERQSSSAHAVGRQLAAGPSGVELETELRGLLDAHSPLLARAFRSSGTV